MPLKSATTRNNSCNKVCVSSIAELLLCFLGEAVFTALRARDQSLILCFLGHAADFVTRQFHRVGDFIVFADARLEKR